VSQAASPFEVYKGLKLGLLCKMAIAKHISTFATESNEGFADAVPPRAEGAGALTKHI
jgi:hypothetical protein